MKITIIDNKDEMGMYVANIIKEIVNNNDKPILGLATGSSPLTTYKYLIEMYNNKEVDFSNVTTFNLDEYYGVDPTHPQSYNYFMQENLFNHININKDNVNLPLAVGDVKENCRKYNEMLKANRRNFQILGIGSNGHIAFNEPGTSFDQETHVIELDEKTRMDNSRFFDSIDEVPKQAFTMGLKNIMNTDKIVLIAAGESKAWAINQLVNGVQTTDVPATILQGHDNVEIVIDKMAASLLNN